MTSLGSIVRRLAYLLERVLPVLAVLVVTAMPSAALKIEDTTVVVPVIAHNPGLLGSEWRTDLWIINPYNDSGTMTLTFYPESGGSATSQVSIEAYRSMVLPDIVLETFGMNDAKGLLVIESAVGRFEARARIFNTGSEAGEYGQAVMGLGVTYLRRQGHIGGVSTANGNRVSVGVANPTDLTYDVSIEVRDASTGATLHFENVTLSPHQVVQFSDVATAWGLPASPNLTVRVNSGVNERYFYAYVSVVRNDTGDAIFLPGTSPNS